MALFLQVVVNEFFCVSVERFCSTLVAHQEEVCLTPTRDLAIYRLIELPAARSEGALEERRRLRRVVLPEIERERLAAARRLQERDQVIATQRRHIEALTQQVRSMHPYGPVRHLSRSRSPRSSV